MDPSQFSHGAYPDNCIYVNQESEIESDSYSHCDSDAQGDDENYHKMDNNSTLFLITISVCFHTIIIWLIGEYNFVFIAYNYNHWSPANEKCIDHMMLNLIGILNLCEVIASVYIFCNSRRIIQYFNDVITTLKIYGGNEIDVQNNLNPVRRMLKYQGIFYAFFIMIEMIPSFLICHNEYTKNNYCHNFWTLDWTRIVFIIFRLHIIIMGLGLLAALFLICLQNLVKCISNKISKSREVKYIDNIRCMD